MCRHFPRHEVIYAYLLVCYECLELFFEFAEPSGGFDVQFTQCFKWSLHTDQTQHCFSTYTDFKGAFSGFTCLVFVFSGTIVPSWVDRDGAVVLSKDRLNFGSRPFEYAS